MCAVPKEIPLTKPVVDPMEAMAVLLLCHVPPAIPSTNKIVEPIHTDDGPVITVGAVVIAIVVVT